MCYKRMYAILTNPHIKSWDRVFAEIRDKYPRLNAECKIMAANKAYDKQFRGII